MYQKCHLIHADLSEYNLLWHRSRIYFIDVSQSVEPSHPNGLQFLQRDCRNISGFFDRAGVRDVMTPHQLFNFVSGLQIAATDDSEFTAQVCIYYTIDNIPYCRYSIYGGVCYTVWVCSTCTLSTSMIYMYTYYE